jgi:hypothetical protein
VIPRGPVASGFGRRAGDNSDGGTGVGDEDGSRSVSDDGSGSGDDDDETETETETEVDSRVGADWDPATGTPPLDFQG